MFKNLIKSLLYFSISIIISCFFLTIFNYFNIFNGKFISIIKFLIPTISICIISYLLGKKAIKKGYLEGLKFGLIIIISFIIISFIFNSFNIKNIIYYLILLLLSILSSMFGINKKKAAN